MTSGHTDVNKSETPSLGALGGRLSVLGLGVGAVGLGAAVALAGGDWNLFGLAYLTGFAYFLSLTLGALFFVIIQHLTRAGWSASIRRVAEIMAANVLTMGLLAIPVLGFVFSGKIYTWAHHGDGHEAGHHFLWGKEIWLKPEFFAARLIACFAIWTGLAWWLWNTSRRQDETGDRQLTETMQKWSGGAVVAFALATSLAAFDLIMSLDPTWYSTMFGIYYFAGSMLSFFAMLILILRFLQSRGMLQKAVTVEHFHDLGKWLFGFTFFWGYIAYSQYMLIWYGNIPEETRWLDVRGVSTDSASRTHSAWGWWSLLLLFGHFLIPFPGLLSRHMKRKLAFLTFWAVWLLVFHLVDLTWVIMPQAGSEESGVPILLVVCAWVGVGGIWLAGLSRLACGQSLLAVRDPRLPEALAFQNY